MTVKLLVSRTGPPLCKDMIGRLKLERFTFGLASAAQSEGRTAEQNCEGHRVLSWLLSAMWWDATLAMIQNIQVTLI